MTARRRLDGPAAFAVGATALAGLALVVTAAVAVQTRAEGPPEGGWFRYDAASVEPREPAEPIDLDDGAVADRDLAAADITEQAAEAMAGVRSVEFRLERSGAPVFIDQFEKLALDDLLGQFTVPTRAQAELTVTVNGDLATKLGAVAIDREVWISNPVTGDFETLPEGYDIDPSKFFDPEGGWQPLLENLQDVELVGIDDRGGDRYHVRGTAPAAEVRNITVGLVRDQDVSVDLWVHPTSSLVTAAEFRNVIDGA